MTTSLKISMALTLCFSTYAVTAEAAPRAPRIQTGPDAEISFDGLHRVDRSVMDMAWAKPTLDLTQYSKLLLVSGGFAYREVDEPSRYNRSATEFPISEENRSRFAETVREIWTEEFEDLENWEIVTSPHSRTPRSTADSHRLQPPAAAATSGSPDPLGPSPAPRRPSTPPPPPGSAYS